MARQVAQIGLGLIGGVIAGPVGFAIGNMAGAALLGPTPPPTSLQKLRIPQTAVGTMFPMVYGGAMPGETLSKTVRGGVRTTGVFIDCSKKGGIIQKGGKASGGTTGAPNANSAPKYLMTAAMVYADARTGPLVVDQIFFNDKCKFDRFGDDNAKGFNVEPEYDDAGNVIAEIGDKLEIYPGRWNQLPSPTLQALHSPEPVPAYRGLGYLVFNKANIKSMPTITVVARNSITGVKQIITCHMKAAGVPEEHIDLCHSNLHVRGAFQNSEGPARDLCEQLARYCYAELTEFDGKIKDVSLILSGTPYRVPREWMAARRVEGASTQSSGAGKAKQLIIGDEPLHTKPSRISVKFSDIGRNWNDNAAPADRKTATHNNPKTVEVGIVSTMAEMLPRARVWLDQEWSANPVSLDVSPALLRHAPGGVVEVWSPTEEDENATQIIRLGRQSLGDVLRWEGTTYDRDVFASIPATTIGTGGGFESVPSYGTPTAFIADPPIYFPEDNDDFINGRLIVGATSTGEWAGARIVWNPSGVPGSNSSLQKYGLGDATEITNQATMGITQTVLNTTRRDFDYNTILRVQLKSGELASATEEDVLMRGANRALLKDNSTEFPLGARWIQFTTATPVSENTYDLTGLLVGRFGTEYITSTANGSQFLLITDEQGEETAGWRRVKVPRLLMNREISYIVESGEDEGNVGPLSTLTCTGNSLRPLAPSAGDMGWSDAGDLVTSWMPRTRNVEQSLLYWSTGAPPTPSDPEVFVVKLYDGVVKVHEEIVLGTSKTFTAANLAAWYGGTPTTVSGTVQQLSAALFGRAGLPLRFSL